MQKYKRLFHNWKNNAPINMPYVRELVVPLFEQIDKIGIEILKLHHYSTKNDYFYHHSIAVGILSTFLAKKLGYNHGESIQVGLAGFLSDCGMAKIDSEVINKFHSLTYREMDEMKEHPKYSYRFIESIPTISKEVKLAIIQHHERLDGSGYPFQLKGKKIHKYARIIAVSDTYHAMTCKRGYRDQISPFEVIMELKQARFRGLDPNIVQILLQTLVNYSVGTKVQLSNGKIGKIIFIQEEQPNRPIVQLDVTDEIVNLGNMPSLFIKDFLN